MKQQTIVRAFNTIQALSTRKLPLSVSHKLWMVMTVLKPHYEFQSQKENEIFDKYQPILKPDGTFEFQSPDAERAFSEEFGALMKEMADLDVDLGDYKKVTLHLDDNIEMSVGDIEALNEFVEFAE